MSGLPPLNWIIVTRSGLNALRGSDAPSVSFKVKGDEDYWLIAVAEGIEAHHKYALTRLRDDGIEVPRWVDGKQRRFGSDDLGEGWYYPRRLPGRI